jgi:integrase
MDLRNPDIRRPHKGRAIVPMNRAAHDSLLEAREGALSEYVIEWAGKRVVSVKRGLKATARAAGIEFSVYPHLFRHSAAVHMAEAGIDMETIAQYLGHEDVTVTRRVYARFSPDYLRAAANVRQYDEIGASGSMNRKITTQFDEAPLINRHNLVGATGIEPVTPTMSR